MLDDLDARAYAYLLGVYLGDGCLVQMPRTWALRVFCDAGALDAHVGPKR